jgi:hypothetical protein
VISSEEATKIALEAAQKVKLRIGYEDGTIKTLETPDLSNAPYSVNFVMLPYRNTETDFPSKLSRDPLTLYPFWQFHFYFEENIAGAIGIQVGVWGDTKEISYASAYVVLGSTDMPNNQALEEQKQSNLVDQSALAVAISLAAVLAIALSVVALRRKNQHK